MFFTDNIATQHFARAEVPSSPSQRAKRRAVHINEPKTAVSEAKLDTYHALHVCRSVMMTNNGTGCDTTVTLPSYSTYSFQRVSFTVVLVTEEVPDRINVPVFLGMGFGWW